MSTKGLMDKLTPRELEVAALVAEGLSNKLIAQRLGLSDHTAKFHLNNVAKKLGVSTRAEVAVKYTVARIIKDSKKTHTCPNCKTPVPA